MKTVDAQSTGRGTFGEQGRCSRHLIAHRRVRQTALGRKRIAKARGVIQFDILLRVQPRRSFAVVERTRRTHENFSQRVGGAETRGVRRWRAPWSGDGRGISRIRAGAEFDSGKAREQRRRTPLRRWGRVAARMHRRNLCSTSLFLTILAEPAGRNHSGTVLRWTQLSTSCSQPRIAKATSFPRPFTGSHRFRQCGSVDDSLFVSDFILGVSAPYHWN
jgi:hypothetical protein